MAAKTSKSSTSTAALNADATLLDVSEIHADYTWNSRLALRAQSQGVDPEVDGDPDAPGDLVATFEATGQRVPVDVRIHEGAYHLVAGFRRYSAAVKLKELNKSIRYLEPGQVRVVVHAKLSDAEASLLNLDENLNRKGLCTPDLAFGVKRLVEIEKSNKDDLKELITAEQLSARFGKSLGHTGQLLKVARKLKDSIFSSWRESPLKALPLATMAIIAEMPKSDQDDAYRTALESQNENEKGKKDEKAWVKSAIRKAKVIGGIMGKAHRMGLVKLDENRVYDDEGTEYIRVFVKFRTKIAGKKVDKKVVGRVAKSFYDAFISEKNKDEEEDSEDEVEEIG